MQRYSRITDKHPREVVLLRGTGCIWKQCRFCDYYLDASPCEEENYRMNLEVLQKVQGTWGRLEVLNSGSYQELDSRTREAIEDLCCKKRIHEMITEVHWSHRATLPQLRKHMEDLGIHLIIKLGLETFDAQYRQEVMRKGIPDVPIEELRAFADQICILVGLEGQTFEGIQRDIEWGLRFFDRICVNVMVANSAELQPDPILIQKFRQKLVPLYRDNPRVDLLENNTDLGVGG